MEQFIIILITASSIAEGEKIAESLVTNHLAACANIVPSFTSIFFWQGKTEKASEVLLIVKSRHALLDKITEHVKKIHSYAIPEIIALPLIGGSEDYLKWVEENTTS
ncbi:MAG: divalent-cation tolerance protein CutA [Nitrospirae bacterium]|nr:divalent-cation tolerance protein CutA [Nitrospirota bacterium]